MSRIEEEKSTVDKMIRLYCRKVHGKRNLCDECTGLHEYAMLRLDKCRFGESKPVCAKCPVHCYKPSCREAMKRVMRFSGPRMILFYPHLSVLHLYRKFKSA